MPVDAAYQKLLDTIVPVAGQLIFPYSPIAPSEDEEAVLSYAKERGVKVKLSSTKKREEEAWKAMLTLSSGAERVSTRPQDFLPDGSFYKNQDWLGLRWFSEEKFDMEKGEITWSFRSSDARGSIELFTEELEGLLAAARGLGIHKANGQVTVGEDPATAKVWLVKDSQLMVAEPA